MSDVPGGPEWFQARDGKWYEPMPQQASPMPPTKPKTNQMSEVKKFLGALLIVALCAGCWAIVASAGNSSSPSNQSGLACDHFRNIAGDIAAGKLTDSELRSKLKEVDDNAVIATPQVKAAAAKMLRGSTLGNVKTISDGISEMSSACSAAGH